MKPNFEDILKQKIDLEHIKTILPSELYYKKLIETYKDVYNLALDDAVEYLDDNEEFDIQAIFNLKI